MLNNQNGNYRWKILALVFFATTINYLDRQVIGLLKPTLEVEFSWSEMDYSYIVMSFTAAYALGFLFFGGFIDKVGSKTGYTVSIIVWSFSAMGHAIANGTFGFAVARTFLGLGEAGNFPAAIKTVAEWFPKKERALATGIFNSGTAIGAISAPVIVPWLLSNFGWQEAFIWTGAVGFIWLFFWIKYYHLPSTQNISRIEYEHIKSDQSESAEQVKLSWKELIKYRATWAFVAGKFMTDPIWSFYLFWLPSYYASTYDMNLKKTSLELVLIYAGTGIGSIGGGYLSSYLIKSGWEIKKARKFTMLIFALIILPVFTIQYVNNIWLATFLFGLAGASHQAWGANLFTTVSDNFPNRYVSSVTGYGGVAGAIGGVLFPLLVGNILDYFKESGDISKGYDIIFIICGISYIVAWVIMNTIIKKSKIITT